MYACMHTYMCVYVMFYFLSNICTFKNKWYICRLISVLVQVYYVHFSNLHIDDVKAQVFESDIIEEEKVYVCV